MFHSLIMGSFIAILATTPIIGRAYEALTIYEGQELTGPATVFDTLLVDGTISPGDSLGRIDVVGAYVQGSHAVHNVVFDAVGNSSLISVIGDPGQAVIVGGELVVTPLNEIYFGAKYEILRTSDGVKGTYDQVSKVGNSRFKPVVDYSDPHVYFLILQPDLSAGAVSFNQHQVASQLDLATSEVPQVNAILSSLITLSDPELTVALDLMSGNQHTADPFIIGVLNREFIRRLYDPLRPIVTTLPCNRCIDPCSYGVDVWFEGGWDRAFLKNDGNGFGCNLEGYQLTLGVQKTWWEDWTVGLAGSYGNDYIHYNLGGHGRMDSGFLGLYGLYRPQCWYVLADVSGSYMNNNLHRPLQVGDLRYVTDSRAEIYDLIGYAEAGFDLPLYLFLLQPFVGIECNTYWRDRTAEHGAGVLDLIVYERRTTSATSRVGIHFSYGIPGNQLFSIDGAWNCRLTDADTLFWQSFSGFGGFFADRGAHYSRNSGEGAITFTAPINTTWKCYLQGSGEIWDNGSDYSLLAGIQASW